MSVEFQRKLITIDDYARMIEAGAFRKNRRVELIDGEVREMSAIGPLHLGVVIRLTNILTKQLADRALVSVQNPVILNDFTEPEPDFVILRLKETFYQDAVPTPKDVLLLIEVSDSSLEYDRDDKVPRYAEMGIPEVWIVDVHGQEVLQYSHPDRGAYQDVQALSRDDELVSVEIESLHLRVDDIFRIGR